VCPHVGFPTYNSISLHVGKFYANPITKPKPNSPPNPNPNPLPH